MNQIFSRLIQLAFLSVILFHIFSPVYMQRQKYFSTNYWQQYPKLEKIYYNSIYKNKHGQFVPDEYLYAYISGALVKGASPIFLNPEVPPFGTYLIGLSAVVFNNVHIIIPFFASVSLLLMFLLGRQIYTNKLVSFLPPVLFSFEPIFKNQLVYTPLLDIIQLTFLLVIFYMFNRAIATKRQQSIYFLCIGVFLGFFISTKFFGTGIAVIGAMGVPLFLHKDWKRLVYLLLTVPVSIIVLYANYLIVLVKGYPLLKFLGIQKWIYLYNTGHIADKLSVWPLLFLNKWYLWFGTQKISSDSQWSISWPILTSISLGILVKSFFIKQTRNIEVLLSWVGIYLLLLSFVQISSRYFVILIPVLYLLAIYAIEKAVLLLIHTSTIKKTYAYRI